jgi:hypothetical protein
VNFLVKGLADAILAKLPTGLPIDVNRVDNKADEIGEVAAFVFEALAAKASVQKLGGAKKYALAVMKNAIKTAKKTGVLSTTIISDVAASVALTIHNDIRFDAIEVKLAKALGKAAKTVAGAPNKSIVQAALAAGFAGTNNTTAEDGNIPTLTTIIDPETDSRNG